MRSLLRLKPYLRPHLWQILASALLAIPLSGIRVSLVPFIKYIFDNILFAGSASYLLVYPALIVGLYLINLPIRFLHFYLMRVVIVRVNQRIKNDLFDHLMGLSADYFTAQSVGTLMNRVSSDPQYIDGGLTSLNTLMREPITFFMLLGYAFHLHWKMTLVAMVIFPPLAWVFHASGRNQKRYIHRLSDENGGLYSQLQESFSGFRVAKMFRLEGYLRDRFRARNASFAHILLKISALEEIAHPIVELLIAIVIALIVFFGARSVLHHHMTAGALPAFFAAIIMMVAPLQNMNQVNMRLHQAAAACDRIFQIFDWRPNLHEPATPKPLARFETAIRLNDVTFAYPDSPERNVLDRVSFTIPKGRVVALVGASGAGKSSLVSLLPRIFDVTGGSIGIDGHDIRDIALHDLRRLMAVVSQDVFLFNDTIEENIRCGRLGATPEEIREAARRAHALEFIERFPGAFKAVIGDRGQKLSGGERQRISIARAFLREAPILILDEATSSLDTTSERAVQAALEELMRERTTLIIAHRLSTIRHADRILVLKEGQVVEEGRHEDLLDRRGEYARFYQGTAEA